MERMQRQNARSGFTVYELVMGATILAILARMVIGATAATSDMTSMGNITARAHQAGEKAMNQIVEDLRMSGYQMVDGLDYPYVFDGGVAEGLFREYSYEPAPMTARPSESDFGVMRSIVLVRPSDLDGNGRPEIDANDNGIPELDGNGDGVVTDEPEDTNGIWDANAVTVDRDSRLSWSNDTITYVVTTGPTGENELVRLVANGEVDRKVLARGVERIQFDNSTSGGVEVSEGEVRVRIFFRIADDEGHVYRSSNEAVIRLRNTPDAG